MINWLRVALILVALSIGLVITDILFNILGAEIILVTTMLALAAALKGCWDILKEMR